jgi:hypothetical protein
MRVVKSLDSILLRHKATIVTRTASPAEILLLLGTHPPLKFPIALLTDLRGGLIGAAVVLPQATAFGVTVFAASLGTASGALAGLVGAIILLLIVLNGFFAMAELAVVSSRKARLRQMAESGRRGALTALRLAENPGRFLSTVQIGITLIGIFAGAFGGATLAEELDVWLATALDDPYLASAGTTQAIIGATGAGPRQVRWTGRTGDADRSHGSHRRRSGGTSRRRGTGGGPKSRRFLADRRWSAAG